jgi:hypothetical protein
MCRSPSIVGSRGARTIRARKLRKKIPARKSSAGICERKGIIVTLLASEVIARLVREDKPFASTAREKR